MRTIADGSPAALTAAEAAEAPEWRVRLNGSELARRKSVGFATETRAANVADEGLLGEVLRRL